jgi:hypothetical protein
MGTSPNLQSGKIQALVVPLSLLMVVANLQRAGPAAEPLPGQIVVYPEDPAHLAYNRDANGDGGLDPLFLCGPGDPEGFLYLGKRSADGTRQGDQLALIRTLKVEGGNCIYLQAVRSHGGDGEPNHNPFADNDPTKGISKPVLDQWEAWLAAMDDAGIVTHFFFYDDGTRPFGNEGDALPEAERRFVQTIVNRSPFSRAATSAS